MIRQLYWNNVLCTDISLFSNDIPLYWFESLSLFNINNLLITYQLNSFINFLAGKAFVEAVKNKTEEELDEEVKMESEDVQVNWFYYNYII